MNKKQFDLLFKSVKKLNIAYDISYLILKAGDNQSIILSIDHNLILIMRSIISNPTYAACLLDNNKCVVQISDDYKIDITNYKLIIPDKNTTQYIDKISLPLRLTQDTLPLKLIQDIKFSIYKNDKLILNNVNLKFIYCENEYEDDSITDYMIECKEIEDNIIRHLDSDEIYNNGGNNINDLINMVEKYNDTLSEILDYLLEITKIIVDENFLLNRRMYTYIDTNNNE
jgi:hypothetical protein